MLATREILIAQDKATSQVFSMPASAIATGSVDHVLPIDEIAPTLIALATEGAAAPAVERTAS